MTSEPSQGPQRTPTDDEIPSLLEALKNSVETLTQRAGAEFEFLADESGLTLDAPTEIVLFRVAQEAVGNALQHSGSDRVRVTLRADDGDAVMTVQDWGSGFDPTAAAVAPEEGRHLGLVGMRERAELLGGSFTIETAFGEGATISIRVPMPAGAVATAGGT